MGKSQIWQNWRNLLYNFSKKVTKFSQAFLLLFFLRLCFLDLSFSFFSLFMLHWCWFLVFFSVCASLVYLSFLFSIMLHWSFFLDVSLFMLHWCIFLSRFMLHWCLFFPEIKIKIALGYSKKLEVLEKDRHDQIKLYVSVSLFCFAFDSLFFLFFFFVQLWLWVAYGWNKKNQYLEFGTNQKIRFHNFLKPFLLLSITAEFILQLSIRHLVLIFLLLLYLTLRFDFRAFLFNQRF